MLGHPFLRVRIYPVAETYLRSEYCNRRSCWSCTCTGGLDGGNAYAHPTGHLALCSYLLLDATALLGALVAHPERLREGQHSDDARGFRRERDAQADFPLLASAAGRDADPVRDACNGLHLPGGCGCPCWYFNIYADTFLTPQFKTLSPTAFP